jgi:hypothetical protein
MEGGNKAGQIERYRQMYNLNYTGAAKVYEMSLSGRDSGSMAEEIEKMQTKREYQSDSQRLQDVLNRLDDKLVTIGEVKFNETEMGIFEDQERHLADILAHLTGGEDGRTTREIGVEGARAVSGNGYARQVDRFFEEQERNELQYRIQEARFSSAENSIFYGGRATSRAPATSGLFNRNEDEDVSAFARLQEYRDSDDNPQAQRAFLEAASILRGLSNEERRTLNDSNSINSAIPSVTTDPDGHKLLEQIRDLLAVDRVTDVEVNLPPD